MTILTHNPESFFAPIGPYHHVAQAGPLIWISGTPGVDPITGLLSGQDVVSQTTQILRNFQTMLASVGAGLEHVVHVNVFLKSATDFAEMNAAYLAVFDEHLPARTVIVVADLPKPGALLTMNLQAVKH